MNNPDLHPRYYWLNNQIILMLPSGLYTKCGCITTFSHPANLEGLIPVDQPGRTSDPWTRPTESEIRSWNKALNQSPPSEESILASATLGGVIGLPPGVAIAESDSGLKYSVGVQAMKLGYGSITPSLQSRTVEWAEATFPNQPTEGKIAHLEDEIKEVRENPNDGEELADCLLLLFNLAGRAGVDLLAEAEKKLAKNKTRVWGKQDERGVVHHVEAQDEPTNEIDRRGYHPHWSLREIDVINQLALKKDVNPIGVVRQALRMYQAIVEGDATIELSAPKH